MNIIEKIELFLEAGKFTKIGHKPVKSKPKAEHQKSKGKPKTKHKPITGKVSHLKRKKQKPTKVKVKRSKSISKAKAHAKVVGSYVKSKARHIIGVK
ncbi:MAG: hypothetical protein ACOC5T_03985 [Elusimicrobiota bacterium]